MQPEHGVLTPSEFRALRSAADDRSSRHGFIVYTLGHTGFRTGELANFTPEWFDDAEYTVTVPDDDSDWQSTSPYAPRCFDVGRRIGQTIVEYLDTMALDEFPVSSNTFHHRLKTVGDDVDLNVNAQVLRRTFAARLRELGAPGHITLKILGLRSIEPSPSDGVIASIPDTVDVEGDSLYK